MTGSLLWRPTPNALLAPTVQGNDTDAIGLPLTTPVPAFKANAIVMRCRLGGGERFSTLKPFKIHNALVAK